MTHTKQAILALSLGLMSGITAMEDETMEQKKAISTEFKVIYRLLDADQGKHGFAFRFKDATEKQGFADAKSKRTVQELIELAIDNIITDDDLKQQTVNTSIELLLKKGKVAFTYSETDGVTFK